MQSDSYKQYLKNALTHLASAQEDIFTSIINLSMEDDLKEWNETIELGESFQFDIELFKRSNDINIQMLTNLIETIDVTCEKIKKINNIDTDDWQ